MRILFFYQYFTTPEGSWSTRAYEFARRWVEAGDSVTVVTSVYDKSDLRPRGLVERSTISGVDVRVINIRLSNKHGFVRRVLTFAVYAVVSSWYAVVGRADVVLASSGPITVGIPGLVARWLKRRPLVFEVRDLWPEGAIQLGILRAKPAIRVARWLERTCYRAARVVVALSPGMADHVREMSPGTWVEVVPNASDNDLFSSPPDNVGAPEKPSGTSVAVYTGTLGTIDDCGQLLDAAATLAALGRLDIRIALVGDGSEGEVLRSRAREEGLDNTHFEGLVSKFIVAGWLSVADVALLPTKNVPFLDTASPNKLFDALAAGVPVVQTTQGWIKVLLEQEKCGLTVPQNDPEAMAQAIISLVDNPELRAEMGTNARRVALEQFDRDLLADKMRQVLLEAAGCER